MNSNYNEINNIATNESGIWDSDFARCAGREEASDYLLYFHTGGDTTKNKLKVYFVCKV